MNVDLLLVAVIFVAVAVIVVAVMTRRAPSSKSIQRVVESVVGTSPRPDDEANRPTPDDKDIHDNLLKFFDLTGGARNALRILVNSESPMSHSELTTELNHYLDTKRRSPLPEGAVKMIVMLLLGSSLIQMKDGCLSPTPAGARVMELIKTPK